MQKRQKKELRELIESVDNDIKESISKQGDFTIQQVVSCVGNPEHWNPDKAKFIGKYNEIYDEVERLTNNEKYVEAVSVSFVRAVRDYLFTLKTEDDAIDSLSILLKRIDNEEMKKDEFWHTLKDIANKISNDKQKKKH